MGRDGRRARTVPRYRAGSRPTPARCWSDDDNHRIQQFDPGGAYLGAVGSAGTGRVSSASRTASRSTRPATHTSPTNSTTAWSSSIRCSAFLGAWGGLRHKTRAARLPARDRQRPGRRHLRRQHGQRSHRGVRPRRALPAHVRRLRAGAGRADGATRAGASTPPGGCSSADTRRQPRRAVRAAGRRLRAGSGRRPAAPLGSFHARRASASTRSACFTSPTRATNGSCACGATARCLVGSAARQRLGGAPLNARGVASPSRPARASCYVADTGHNRVLVYDRDGSLIARWGAGRRQRRRRQRRHGGSTGRRGVAVSPGAANVYVADTGNNRVVQLSPSGDVARASGARAAAATAASALPPAWRSTRPASCTCSTAKTTACRCSTRPGASSASGACAAPGSAYFSQPTAIAVGLHRRGLRGRHEQQPRRAIRPASSGDRAVPGRRLLASPAGRRAGAPRRACRTARGVLARRALALAVSCERGCKVLASATLATARRPPRSVRLIAAARSLPAAGQRHRAHPRRQARAAQPARRARSPPVDERARAHRRRGADRAAHRARARLPGRAASVHVRAAPLATTTAVPLRSLRSR